MLCPKKKRHVETERAFWLTLTQKGIQRAEIKKNERKKVLWY